jgi:CheY-like chemotaxis protein
MNVTILVVDDEADVAELFRQQFMHFAQSGEEALAKLDDGIRPELKVVLSDINMPGMDGLTLLKAARERFPDLPVIMVTVYGDDDRRRQARDYGAMEASRSILPS